MWEIYPPGKRAHHIAHPRVGGQAPHSGPPGLGGRAHHRVNPEIAETVLLNQARTLAFLALFPALIKNRTRTLAFFALR